MGMAVLLNACQGGINLKSESLTALDKNHIAETRQHVLETQPSNKPYMWHGDTVRGTMVVIGTYTRQDGIFCRQLLESTYKFIRQTNIISTWCRTEDNAWTFYR